MSYQVLWFATRGAGAVSLILLSGVVVLGLLARLRVESRGWPRFLSAAVHGDLALMTLVFLLLHIVTAIVDPFTHLGLAALVPFGSYYRTFWLGLGAIAFELLLAIVATSLLRHHIGARTWRAIHWLAYACWPVAVLHGIGTGTDTLRGLDGRDRRGVHRRRAVALRGARLRHHRIHSPVNAATRRNAHRSGRVDDRCRCSRAARRMPAWRLLGPRATTGAGPAWERAR